MSPLALQFQDLRFREVPARALPAKGLLVLVHGRTGNLRVLEFFAKRTGLDTMAKLLIEAPYADKRDDQRALRNDQADERHDQRNEAYSWYLRSTDREASPETGLRPIIDGQLQDSRRRLSALVDALLDAGWASTQIYWLGFSQGSAMILDLALRDSRRFGGFVCVSGFCLVESRDSTLFSPTAWDQKILITHGSRDEIVTLADAERSYDFLRSLKIPFTWKVFDKPHSFKLKDELPLIESQLLAWMHNQE